jgi:hypothetical protein
MAGPWQKYGAAQPSGAPAGPWAKYSAPKEEAPAAGISKTESAARGVAQGGTLGFADEIAGATEALWEKAKGDPRAFGEMYKQFRDESRSNFDAAKKENPVSYGAGEVGGGIATAFVPGLAIAKGARLANVAAKSAMLGAGAGAGYSTGENAKEVLKDAATGSVVGGVLGAGTSLAAPLIGKAAAAVGGKAKETAERLAARAIGAERATVKRLGADGVQRVGRYALDEKIISPLASTDDMIARNQAAKAKGAAKMGEVYDAIDSEGKSAFNPLEVATKVEQELSPAYRTPINKSEWGQLDNTVESILQRGNGSLPMKEAQALKQEIGSVAYPKGKRPLDPSPKQQMAMDAYAIINKAIDDAADSGADAIGKDGLKEILSAGKKLYGNSKSAEMLLDNKNAREQGNKLLGLTDWGILGVGAPAAAMTGGATALPTLAAVAGKKGLERFGAQNAAIALDKFGNAITKSPKALESLTRNPVIVENAGAISARPKLNQGVRKVSESEEQPKKGPEKWANDGLAKLQKHGSDADKLEKAKADAKGKKLLIAASDLKPGSKAMGKIVERIEQLYGASTSKR